MNKLASAFKVVGCIVASFALFISGLVGLFGTLCGGGRGMNMVYLLIVVSAVAVVAFVLLIIHDNDQRRQDKKKTR